MFGHSFSDWLSRLKRFIFLGFEPLGWGDAFHFLEGKEKSGTCTETAFFVDAVYFIAGGFEGKQQVFGFFDPHGVHQFKEVALQISIDGAGECFCGIPVSLDKVARERSFLR